MGSTRGHGASTFRDGIIVQFVYKYWLYAQSFAGQSIENIQKARATSQQYPPFQDQRFLDFIIPNPR
jgi:hypothetical protein